MPTFSFRSPARRKAPTHRYVLPVLAPPRGSLGRTDTGVARATLPLSNPMRHLWARHSSTIYSFLRAPPVLLLRPPVFYRPGSASAITVLFYPKRRHHTRIIRALSEEMETVDTTARLASLRSLMKQKGVDIYGKFTALP